VELKEVIVEEIRYIRLARRSITIIGMIGATRRFIMIEREGMVGLTYQLVAWVLNVESSRNKKFRVGFAARSEGFADPKALVGCRRTVHALDALKIAPATAKGSSAAPSLSTTLPLPHTQPKHYPQLWLRAHRLQISSSSPERRRRTKPSRSSFSAAAGAKRMSQAPALAQATAAPKQENQTF